MEVGSFPRNGRIARRSTQIWKISADEERKMFTSESIENTEKFQLFTC